jgi:hypothetical protein
LSLRFRLHHLRLLQLQERSNAALTKFGSRLSLSTDQFPAETTWELSNIGNTFTLKGGLYKLPNTDYKEGSCVPD